MSNENSISLKLVFPVKVTGYNIRDNVKLDDEGKISSFGIGEPKTGTLAITEDDVAIMIPDGEEKAVACYAAYYVVGDTKYHINFESLKGLTTQQMYYKMLKQYFM